MQLKFEALVECVAKPSLSCSITGLTKGGLHTPCYFTFMAQERISLPSGMGGLVRYFDEYKSKISLKPGHVIVLSVVVMVVMVFLYIYGNRIVGI